MPRAGMTVSMLSFNYRLLCHITLVMISLLLLSVFGFAQETIERHSLSALASPQGSASDTDNNITTSSSDNGGDRLAQQGTMPENSGDFVQVGEADDSVELLDNSAPLRIGLMAEHGPTYLQSRIAPFRSYLRDTLERPIEITAFNDINMLIAAHTARQIDYAVYPASIFAMAQASCGCLLPLVAPVSELAPDGIYMLLVVRSDSGIKSLADMTGRSMALSSTSAAVPFHLALHQLRTAGLNPEKDLATVVSKDNPAAALALLEERKVDAALVWSTTSFNRNLFSAEGAISAYQDTKKTRRNPKPSEPDFISIWQSQPVPAGPHVVHKDMTKQERADLQNALTSMLKRDPAAYDAIERVYGGGFRAVTLEDYAALIDIATAK